MALFDVVREPAQHLSRIHNPNRFLPSPIIGIVGEHKTRPLNRTRQTSIMQIFVFDRP
jgi:hypothetical protein